MLKINIQLFAHKKGMGSTKNGRDSESKRLGVKRAASSVCGEAHFYLAAGGAVQGQESIRYVY